MGRGTAVATSLCLTAALVWGAAFASGAAGDLTYLNCYTAATQAGPTPGGGNGACEAAGTTTASGSNSGFDNVRSTVVSPDGTSLYATASSDSSVVQFARDPATGALTYLGCISGKTVATNCTQMPVPTAGGDDSGLGGAQGIAISPDGNSVYVAADSDDAIARFARNPGTGVLTYQDCITGEEASGPAAPLPGSGACSEVPSVQASGNSSGLDFPQSLAATNTSLYVAARDDDAVARFSRDVGTGALTYQGCMTAETQSGPAGTSACTLLAGASSSGSNSGLDVLQTASLSPDGTSLYTASQADSAVGRFDRDTGTGVLTYQGCISGETNSAVCSQIPSATLSGANSGMFSTYAVAVSPEGNSVYSISENDDAVARFDRAPGGALTYQGCFSGSTGLGTACALIPSVTTIGSESGLDKLRAVVVNPNGGAVYVAAPQDDAVAWFARDPATGALAYAGCITSELGTGPTGTNACPQIPSAAAGGVFSGLNNPQSLAISSNGASLYAGAANDAGIARFSVELPPAETGDTEPPDTQITGSPKKKTKTKKNKKKAKAKFEFTGTDARAVASFQCKLDDDPFAACTPPFEDKVKKGRHHFEVRAIDAAGNVDPTPASFDWKVKKKKKKK